MSNLLVLSIPSIEENGGIFPDEPLLMLRVFATMNNLS